MTPVKTPVANGRRAGASGRADHRALPRSQSEALPAFAYGALKDDILTGRLAPGMKLTQTGLSERLDISRTPVREALLRLEQDGLVRIPSDGSKPIVAPLDPDELEELYLILGVLEGLAARLTARRLTGFGASRLQAAFEAESRHETGAFPGEQLHLTIVDESGSARLASEVGEVRIPISRYRNLLLANTPAQSRSHSYHKRILDAIISGDGEAAERIMIQHMADAFAEIVNALRANDHELQALGADRLRRRKNVASGMRQHK